MSMFPFHHHHITCRKWRHLANVVRSNWFKWNSVFIHFDVSICARSASNSQNPNECQRKNNKKKKQKTPGKTLTKRIIYFVMKIAAMHIGYHNIMRALQFLLHFKSILSANIYGYKSVLLIWWDVSARASERMNGNSSVYRYKTSNNNIRTWWLWNVQITVVLSISAYHLLDPLKSLLAYMCCVEWQ